MKSDDLKMVAAYLSQEDVFDDFAIFIETQFDIDAETEASVIVENIEVASDVMATMEQQKYYALQDAMQITVSGDGLEGLLSLPPGRFERLQQELSCE